MGAAAAMVNADRRRVMEAQRQRIARHMQRAAEEFERALHHRARLLADGKSAQSLPAVLPHVPDALLVPELGACGAQASLDAAVGREYSRRPQCFEAVGAGAAGRREGEVDLPLDLRTSYEGDIDRELERMGGVENVPPLSSLIEQLESQDGNTL